MKILDGKKLSSDIANSLKEKFLQIKNPTLAVVQIGDNAASNIYVSRKVKVAEQLGAAAKVFKLKENISESEVINKIKELNLDKNINGIIIQIPLPQGLNFSNLISEINPEKDVDGLGAYNIYNLVINQEKILPATTRGIISLLEKNNIQISGKKITVVGRSLLVGKSLSLALINRNATVTVCHSKTENLAEICSSADVLVSAVGNPDLISSEFTNPNQVVIDVGITIENNLMKGDSDSNIEVYAKSPVPGGVGPMTVISLFENLLDACLMQQKGE